MQKQYNFLVCGYYGAGNWGDDLILRGIVNDLKSRYADSRFYITAVNPGLIKDDNCIGVYHTDFSNIEKIISKSSAVIIGGGGLIIDRKNVFGEYYYSDLFTVPAGGNQLYLAYVSIANSYKVPAISWSIGVEKISNKLQAIQVKELFDRVDYISVRDSRSKENLVKLGIKEKNINIFHDPVLRTENKETVLDNSLGISLRSWPGLDSAKRAIAEAVGEFCLREGIEANFYVFQELGEELTNDLKATNNITDLLDKRVKFNIIKFPQEIRDRYFIGMRLHSLILALNSGVSPIAISYAEKINDLYAEANIQSPLIPISRLTYKTLSESLVEIKNTEFPKTKNLYNSPLDMLGINFEEKNPVEEFITIDIPTKNNLNVLISTIEDNNQKIELLNDKLGIINEELDNIKKSKTWRYGVLMGIALKQPKQWPRIAKRILIKVVKTILPQGTRTRIKKFMGQHPYLTNPRLLIHLHKNKQELKQILANEKYKGIIIYPPTIDWDMPLFQRPQQLALAMAEVGYLFFYGTANLNHDKVHGFKKIQDNLYVTDQIELLKDIDNTALFISWSINKYFVDKFPKSKLIYDYIDELDVFDAAGSTAQEMINSHKFLVERADLVVCTADKLLDDVKKLKPKRTVLAPNAVTLSQFSKKPQNPPKDIEAIVKSGKKIVGYYGAIAEWFDYKLLEEVAELRPDYEFIMIGPLDYDKTLHENKHLFEIKNIHFVGPKKFTELPNYLHYFDVATIPFLVNKITESTSPVKLFEYMAGGRPIVTTGMHECRKYKSVLIGENINDFAKKLDKAIVLSKDKKYQEQLAKDAKDNTWSKRAEDIIKNI